MSLPVVSETVSSAADVALPDAPPNDVPADLRTFVRAERLARPSGARSLVHILVVLAAWVGLVITGFAIDAWPAWIVIWAALAVCTATPLALMHEAVHQNLFRSRVANHVTGAVAAAWLFFHGPAYRAWHLTHHAYTFGPDDSEQLPERFRSRLGYLGYSLVLGPSFAAILWAGAGATVVGRPPRWISSPRLRAYVRRWSVVPVVALAVVVVGLVEWPAVVLRGWLVPAALGSILVFPFLTMPEHYEGRGRQGLLANTRTTTSNRFLRYLYWNNNLHTAHHLVPTVPPHALGRLDDRIVDRNTLRDRGFVAFHRRVLRDLPWFPSRDSSGDPSAAYPPAGDAPADPAAVEPVAVTRVSAGPLSITRVCADPASVDPVAVQPVPVQPVPVEPVPVGQTGGVAAPCDAAVAASPRRGAVTLTISNRVDPVHLPRLWHIYSTAFEPLRELALLNHLSPRDVFDELVLDDRVFKVIGWVDGEPVGVAVVTNHLELVPQISPPYLHRRYPELVARNAVFFGVFVCVEETSRAKSVTARLIAGMAQVAALRSGVVICDISQYNRDRGVDRMIGRITEWFPGSSFELIDSQHFFEAVYPEPLDRLPFANAPMPDVVLDLTDRRIDLTDPDLDTAIADLAIAEAADVTVEID
jgi:fatty acid desaturase